ncbi:arginase family protein [Propionispora vibrioides]|uniref:Arginase n=1 Tax=Propionispora vibrioides TaxID=112903 RepID=A0A1H8XI27_9FIRM|nr:arginase family protein [Propionispora vibrioides]SEP39463.1 arginase [Propionispora vibrioides]
MKKHLNLFFPQWQGGGPDRSTYDGALELKKLYFKEIKFSEVEVSTEDIDKSNNIIIGYTEILKQLKRAKKSIARKLPETIFTVGGGCDADVASIAYLNDKMRGDLTVLWLDAHGDMNTHETSASKYFYGMPLRTLLGEGEETIVKLVSPSLLPSQVIMLGIRDLDEAEKEYITAQNISVFTVQDMEQRVDSVIETVKTKGHRSIYIHIDLDVLDFEEFPHVPVPVPAGLKVNTFKELLKKLDKEFKLVGLGLFEYQPSGQTIELIEDIIKIGVKL